MLKKYYLTDFFGRPYHTNDIKTCLGLPLLKLPTLSEAILFLMWGFMD